MLTTGGKVAVLFAEASAVAASLHDYCLEDAKKICQLALKFKEGADNYFKEEDGQRLEAGEDD